MAYTLEHDPIDTGHLVSITGELDIAATPELSTVLAMAAASPVPGGTVVLDLAGVEFIDSTALGTILKAGGEIESAGKRLVVVCAAGPVRRLLEMTNLTQRFQLCPTRDEALALGTAGSV
jgi:anti-sigma B factor antagonist